MIETGAVTPGGRSLSRHADRIPVYLAAALLYIMLLPPQLNLSIGGSVLPPYRIFLIPASLYILVSGLRGKLTIRWPDIFIIAATAWIWLALSMAAVPADWYTAAGAQTVDILLAYMFARVVFGSLTDLRIWLILIAPALAATGAIIALEAITHTHIIQGIAGNLTGGAIRYSSDLRLGLMRAMGPFPHPIGAGVFLAVFLPLYALSGVRGWPRLAGIFAALCAFFTVSSAALLGLAAGICLIGYNWLTEKFADLTWRLFLILGAMLVFALEFGTGSGAFGLIIRFASLNSLSAYNRVLIWRYGTQNVESHPWFGIGYADWERPSWMVSSVDHYWLLMAMQFGVLVPVCVALACVLAILALMKRTACSTMADRRAEQGLAMAMIVFALGAASVALWLSPQIWFYLLLGIAVSLGYRNHDATGGEGRRSIPRPDIRSAVRP